MREFSSVQNRRMGPSPGTHSHRSLPLAASLSQRLAAKRIAVTAHPPPDDLGESGQAHSYTLTALPYRYERERTVIHMTAPAQGTTFAFPNLTCGPKTSRRQKVHQGTMASCIKHASMETIWSPSKSGSYTPLRKHSTKRFWLSENPRQLVIRQDKQSMSDANRRLSAVQGERRRHILHPFTTVSSPRQPRRALSQGSYTHTHTRARTHTHTQTHTQEKEEEM